MHIPLRHADDRDTLDRLIRAERNAKQRDRLRAVRLALDGRETAAIQEIVGRGRDFVQRWCYAYRDRGIEAIRVKRQSGRPTKLARDREAALCQRLDAGPTKADGVCTLRGVEVTRVLEQEFGVRYSLQGAYDLLHRLGYSCLKPRPRHRKNDPEAMRRWLDDAPLFVRGVRAQHTYQKIEVWFQDEARIGQQGTLTRVWAPRGGRPTAVKQTEYEWVYLYAAVNPVTGESSALITPTVNTGYMNAHLRSISEQVGPLRHVVLVLDRAGWHVAKNLEAPANMTLLHLPPYSPELNPVERVWAYLKSHYLSNRIFTDYDDLFAVTRDSWNSLVPDRLRTITHTAWIEHEN